MRRILTSLAGFCVFAAVALAAPQARAQQAPTDLTELYHNWQQTQDPEQIIALGEQLLALEPSATTWLLTVERAQVKAEVQFGVGSAYVGRQRGIRSENLEKAIAHLQAALIVFTRERDPQVWGRAQNNIGIAYWGRIQGERADNQENAIAHFEQALAIFSRETAEREWAQLQNNLAIVYLQRIRGERADNQEKTISHLEAALTVFARETEPLLWAQAQTNLGSAYSGRVQGERADNREKAIEHLEAALTVLTREGFPYEWGSAQANLGNIYLDRIRGDRPDNQEKAISYFQAALTVFTQEAFPRQWATTQRASGNAYSDRILGDRTGNRGKAIAAYEAALSVFTRDALPFDHMLTGRLLGRAFLEAGENSKAGLAYANARDAFLLLFGQGLEEAGARNLIAEAGPLFAEAAFVALQQGDIEAGLMLAGEGRARLLAVTMKLQTLELSPSERSKLDELRAGVRAAEQLLEAAQGTDRAAALEKLAALRQELLNVIKAQHSKLGDPSAALAEARALAATGAMIAMPIVTALGTKIVVMTNAAAGKGLTVIDLPELTLKRLSTLLIGPDNAPPAGWIAAYFINYLDGEELLNRWPEWVAAVDGLGQELWHLYAGRLDAALKGLGAKRGARLFWLPSGWLSVLPLGMAQDPTGKKRLADEYEITYAPSLEALATARHDVAKPRPVTLAAVINPTGDLPGTEAEGAMVASYFASSARTLLKRGAATPEAVLAALKNRTHWHFASHGSFSWADARQSALLMNGREPLSVGKLLDTDGLGRPRLVVLSACETGLIDITSNPDEFIGLPGTFMAIGAAGVVGTLWPVSDEATALLMAKFYELHMAARLPPSTALHRAQAWLRGATRDDLKNFAKAAVKRGHLEGNYVAQVEQALDAEKGKAASKGSTQPAQPYAHPYYWAGFTYTGI
jgi:CHAT domain-containing protein/tetratricopeptide (TPR) repeat protein